MSCTTPSNLKSLQNTIKMQCPSRFTNRAICIEEKIAEYKMARTLETTSILKRNLLEKLSKSTCTNDVAAVGKTVSKLTHGNKTATEKFKKFLMEEKLRDARKVANKAIRQRQLIESQIYEDIDEDSNRAKRMRKNARIECGKIWSQRTEKNIQKVTHLKKKNGKPPKAKDEQLEKILKMTTVPKTTIPQKPIITNTEKSQQKIDQNELDNMTTSTNTQECENVSYTTPKLPKTANITEEKENNIEIVVMNDDYEDMNIYFDNEWDEHVRMENEMNNHQKNNTKSDEEDKNSTKQETMDNPVSFPPPPSPPLQRRWR